MSDGERMASAPAMADKTGSDGAGGGSPEGSDSAKSAFRVGDRVRALIEDRPMFSGMGTITKRLPPYAVWPWEVSLDGGIVKIAYAEDELTLLQSEPWDGWQAVDSLTKSWSVQIEEACEQLSQLLVAKRKAYGPKTFADSPYGWEVALITRLHEKLARLIHIQQNPDDGSFEDLAESFKDLAGLAILGWIQAEEE